MAVTPTGSPAWTRTTDFSHYGGDADKANYQSQGAVDPLTDVTAEQLSRLAADLASAVRTCPFCVLTFLADDTGAGPPTVEYVNLMTGVSAASYTGDNPPAGFPTVERSSDGIHVITLDSSYTDPYGVAGTFIPRQATASPEGSTAFDTSVVISGQTVTVYAIASGSPATDKRVTVKVW